MPDLIISTVDLLGTPAAEADFTISLVRRGRDAQAPIHGPGGVVAVRDYAGQTDAAGLATVDLAATAAYAVQTFYRFSLNGYVAEFTMPVQASALVDLLAAEDIVVSGGGGGTLAAVQHDDTLEGAGTVASPLAVAEPYTQTERDKLAGVADGATAGLPAVTSDASLTGDGTTDTPLAVARPYPVADSDKLAGVADGANVGLTAVTSDDSLTGDGTGGSGLAVARPYPEADSTKLAGIADGANVGLTAVTTDDSLTGDGTSGSGLAVARPYPEADSTKLAGVADGANVGLTAVTSDDSLTGDGTSGSGLAVARPYPADIVEAITTALGNAGWQSGGAGGSGPNFVELGSVNIDVTAVGQWVATGIVFGDAEWLWISPGFGDLALGSGPRGEYITARGSELRGLIAGVAGVVLVVGQFLEINISSNTYYLGRTADNELLFSSSRAASDAMPLTVVEVQDAATPAIAAVERSVVYLATTNRQGVNDLALYPADNAALGGDQVFLPGLAGTGNTLEDGVAVSSDGATINVSAAGVYEVHIELTGELSASETGSVAIGNAAVGRIEGTIDIQRGDSVMATAPLSYSRYGGWSTRAGTNAIIQLDAGATVSVGVNVIRRSTSILSIDWSGRVVLTRIAVDGNVVMDGSGGGAAGFAEVLAAAITDDDIELDANQEPVNVAGSRQAISEAIGPLVNDVEPINDGNSLRVATRGGGVSLFPLPGRVLADGETADTTGDPVVETYGLLQLGTDHTVELLTVTATDNVFGSRLDLSITALFVNGSGSLTVQYYDGATWHDSNISQSFVGNNIDMSGSLSIGQTFLDGLFRRWRVRVRQDAPTQLDYLSFRADAQETIFGRTEDALIPLTGWIHGGTDTTALFGHNINRTTREHLVLFARNKSSGTWTSGQWLPIVWPMAEIYGVSPSTQSAHGQFTLCLQRNLTTAELYLCYGLARPGTAAVYFNFVGAEGGDAAVVQGVHIFNATDNSLMFRWHVSAD